MSKQSPCDADDAILMMSLFLRRFYLLIYQCILQFDNKLKLHGRAATLSCN